MSWTPASRNRSARTPQLGVEPLEHAQAELALALDRHDAGMRQLDAWHRP